MTAGLNSLELGDYATEQKRIAGALRPVLVSLIEQCRLACSIDGAMPMIEEAAGVIAGLFVDQLQAASVSSFNDGVSAGLLRGTGGPLQ